MASTLRTGAPPPALVVAVEALQRIAALEATRCYGCRDLEAEVAAGRLPDPRVEREHRRNCAGEIAWAALVQILRPTKPAPTAPPAPGAPGAAS